MNRSKHLFSPATFLTLIVIFVGFYVYQNSEHAADTKIYANEDFGVRFKYPSNWFLSESQNNVGAYSIFVSNYPSPDLATYSSKEWRQQAQQTNDYFEFFIYLRNSKSTIPIDGCRVETIADTEIKNTVIMDCVSGPHHDFANVEYYDVIVPHPTQDKEVMFYDITSRPASDQYGGSYQRNDLYKAAMVEIARTVRFTE